MDHKLLKRFLENNCSPEEISDLRDWISTPEGKELFVRQFDEDINFLDKETGFYPGHEVPSLMMYQKILDKINSLEEEKKEPVKTRWLNLRRYAAAGIIILLLANSLIWLSIIKTKNEPVSWNEVYVPQGEKMQVLFQDGSRAFLNSDSKLWYPSNFSGRKRLVKLDGEAYFKVAKNPAKEFIVEAGEINIIVTGTAFDVKNYSSDNYALATLDQGSITFKTIEGKAEMTYYMKPGQKARYEKLHGNVEISEMTIGENSRWQNDEISFNDTPLSEVVKTLERRYKIKIIVADPEILNYQYTIRFKNEPISFVLKGLERITPVKCITRDSTITIYKYPKNESKK